MPTFPRKITGPSVKVPSSIGPSMTTQKVTETINKDGKAKGSAYNK